MPPKIFGAINAHTSFTIPAASADSFNVPPPSRRMLSIPCSPRYSISFFRSSLVYTAELAEFGIEEVGSVGDLLILRKSSDGTPFELYSDLDSRIAQQKKAVRYLRKGLIMSFFWGSMMLMNVLTTLMNANVIGRYAGVAAIRFSSAQIVLLTAASLLLLVCIVGLIDCPVGLRRAKQKIAALEAERVIQE